MSENSNTDGTVEFSGEATNDIEIHLAESEVDDFLSRLNVPFPPASDIDKVLIHIKHELAFNAGLRDRENHS